MTDLRASVIAEARSWAGTPYRHQASLKGVGCDCLGLVRGVWQAIYGEEPESAPAYSSDWAEASKEETLLLAARRHMIEVAIADIAPGDVILFRWRPHLPAKHCGILTEPGRLIHAYDSAGKVAEGNLAKAWALKISAVFSFPSPGSF